MEQQLPSVIEVTDEDGAVHWTSPHSELAKQVAESEQAKAEELPEPPRGGPGSGVEAWREYAAQTGVEINDDMTRDDIVAAVDLAKEEADGAAEPSGQGDDRDSGTIDSGSGVGEREAGSADPAV
jgi:hypothetical protein